MDACLIYVYGRLCELDLFSPKNDVRSEDLRFIHVGGHAGSAPVGRVFCVMGLLTDGDQWWPVLRPRPPKAVNHGSVLCREIWNPLSRTMNNCGAEPPCK